MTHSESIGTRPLLLVEDDSATNRRNRIVGVADASTTKITLTLHEVTDTPTKLKSRTYVPYGLAQSGRAELVAKLVAPHLTRTSIVVGGTRFGENGLIRRSLTALHASFILEITPAAYREVARIRRRALLKHRIHWNEISIQHPVTAKPSLQRVAELEPIQVGEETYRAIAFQFGGVADARMQTRIALISTLDIGIEDIARALAWVRWIHPVRRRTRRSVSTFRNGVSNPPRVGTIILQARSNIQLARQQDENIFRAEARNGNLRRRLITGRTALNTVELFAGGGGMGVGLLMSERPFRVIASAEVHPISLLSKLAS